MLWIYLTIAGITITEEHRFSLDALDLFSASPMAVTESGNLILLDKSEQQLVYVSPQGLLIRRLGGQGQGPGELERPDYLQWLPTQKWVAVADRQTNRTSFWDQQGRFVRSVSNLNSVSFNLIYLSDTQIVHDADPTGVFEGHPKLILSTIGQEDRLLFSHQLKNKKPVPMVTLQENEIFSKRLPWDTELIFGAGPDFVVVSFSETNLVHLRGHNGEDLVAPFPSRLPLRRLTQARIHAFLNTVPERFQKPMEKIISKPEYLPRLKSVRVDNHARIWLLGPKSSLGSAVPFRVIDRKANLLGEGGLPGTPVVVAGEQLYLFEENVESGQIDLVRMRITKME